MDCFEYLDRISCCWRIYHAWVGNFKMADKVDEGHMSMTLHGLCLLHISQDTLRSHQRVEEIITGNTRPHLATASLGKNGLISEPFHEIPANHMTNRLDLMPLPSLSPSQAHRFRSFIYPSLNFLLRIEISATGYVQMWPCGAAMTSCTTRCWSFKVRYMSSGLCQPKLPRQ